MVSGSAELVEGSVAGPEKQGAHQSNPPHDPAESGVVRVLPRSNSIARDYSNEQYVTDVTIDWLYTPHSLIALGVCVLFLVSSAFDERQFDPKTSLMRGLGSASFVFIVLGQLVFPSGPFTRPHPALWRAVFAVSVLYLFGLVVLLFQDVDTARWAMTFFDSSLNVQRSERLYATDCRITWETLHSQIFDRFVVAHFLGWIAKSLVMRNRLVCWFSSITWELVEISFTHVLPNFAECWWDQVILDVLICNGLGIEIGYVLCRYLEVQKYEWSGIRQTQTMAGKAKRLLLQLSPHSWMTVKWEFTSNWKRFLTLQALLLAFQIKDLNSFFLKSVLWIPDSHPLNVYRIILLFFVGIPSLRQIYIYMSDSRCKRLGSQAWVLTLIIVAEMLIGIKFGKELFQTTSTPWHVKVMWVVLLPCYAFVCVSILLKSKRSESPKQAKLE